MHERFCPIVRVKKSELRVARAYEEQRRIK